MRAFCITCGHALVAEGDPELPALVRAAAPHIDSVEDWIDKAVEAQGYALRRLPPDASTELCRQHLLRGRAALQGALGRLDGARCAIGCEHRDGPIRARLAR